MSGRKCTAHAVRRHTRYSLRESARSVRVNVLEVDYSHEQVESRTVRRVNTVARALLECRLCSAKWTVHGDGGRMPEHWRRCPQCFAGGVRPAPRRVRPKTVEAVKARVLAALPAPNYEALTAAVHAGHDVIALVVRELRAAGVMRMGGRGYARVDTNAGPTAALS